jgi:hypothetical protein
MCYNQRIGQQEGTEMENLAFYSKYDFVKLLRQKRGKEYTLGWLEMAYAMPPTTEEYEQEMIRKEIPVLQALPDYEGV